MQTQDRTPDPRHLPDNIIRLDARPERRAPQRWWERARAGELYGRDENGEARVKDYTDAA